LHLGQLARRPFPRLMLVHFAAVLLFAFACVLLLCAFALAAFAFAVVAVVVAVHHHSSFAYRSLLSLMDPSLLQDEAKMLGR